MGLYKDVGADKEDDDEDEDVEGAAGTGNGKRNGGAGFCGTGAAHAEAAEEEDEDDEEGWAGSGATGTMRSRKNCGESVNRGLPVPRLMLIAYAKIEWPLPSLRKEGGSKENPCAAVPLHTPATSGRTRSATVAPKNFPPALAGASA